MSHRLPLALALVVALLAVPGPVVAQSEPTPAVLADDTLRTAVGRLATGQEAGPAVTVVDGRVLVEVLYQGPVEPVTEAVVAVGGQVQAAMAGVAEAWVPWDQLAALEVTAVVDFLRVPVRVDQPADGLTAGNGAEQGFLNQAVTKTQADRWHRTESRGEGVRIGVLDLFDQRAWAAAQAVDEVPAPGGTFCRVAGSSDCTVWDAEEVHGVAVAEVLADMAPDAELYLALAATTNDVHAAIEWFAENGVTVVTRSLTSPFDGPGDGTGPLAAVLDEAVAQGMSVYQAAGNAAGRYRSGRDGSYLRFEYADQDGDGWLEFAPGVERLRASCGYLNGLRWDDFGEGAATTDYDLHVYDGNGAAVTASQDDQAAGAPPIEVAEPCRTARVQYGVRLTSDAAEADGDVLELMASGSAFEYWNNPGSAGGPGADSANPGVLAVGAVDPAAGAQAGYYSAQGPTNDGRLKPDLVAPSCLGSFFASRCFSGTSASAPVAAGAAALYLATQPTATPTEVTAWLIDHAVDRGRVGADMVHGAGEVMLPARGLPARFRPDALIRVGQNGPQLGDRVYGVDRLQTARVVVAPGTARFTVTIQNDGNYPERIFVGGSRSALGYRISYGTPAITRQVNAGSYRTPLLAPGEDHRLTVSVVVPRTATPGTGIEAEVGILSQGDLRSDDTVVFVVIRR